MPLVLEPGDVAVFGGFTPHRSDPNLSDRWRRQLYLSYNAALRRRRPAGRSTTASSTPGCARSTPSTARPTPTSSDRDPLTTERAMPMSDPVRFHLSLNVADLAKSVAFFRTLFGIGAGQAAGRLRQVRAGRPAAGAVAGAGAGGRPRRGAQPPRVPPAGREGAGGDAGAAGAGRAADEARGGRRVLLRPADEVLGPRPGREPVGGVHVRRRHRPPRRRAVGGGRPRRRAAAAAEPVVVGAPDERAGAGPHPARRRVGRRGPAARHAQPAAVGRTSGGRSSRRRCGC